MAIINKKESPNFPRLLFFETEIGFSSSYPNCLLPQFKHVRKAYYCYNC